MRVLIDEKEVSELDFRDLIDKIILGDARRVLKKLPSESVDMVFLDPPYYLQLPPNQKLLRWYNKTLVNTVHSEWDYFESYEEYDSFVREILIEVKRIMRRNATIWAIGSYHNIFRIGRLLQDLGFWILNTVVWFKTNPMPNWYNVRMSNATEFLVWAVKDRSVKDYTYNHEAALEYSARDFGSRIALNIWRVRSAVGRERLKDENGRRLHPTQKPEELLERVIRVSTREGDLVLDPMAGTGTTGVVAKRMNRRFILIEINKRYAEAAEKRIIESLVLAKSRR
ncbi:MAG: site-specific DNA-methyltransferase [Sulfolobales archaeon]